MQVENIARMEENRLRRVVVASLFVMMLVVFWGGNHLYAAELVAPATQDAPAHGGDGNGDGSGDLKVYGLLTISPTEGMTGTWVIGSVEYTATEETQFDTLHGDFVLNGCVEVEVSESDPTVATKISTEELSKCSDQPGGDNGGDQGGDGNGGNDGGDHEGDHEDGDKGYGVIDALPESGLLTGTWIISGVPYSVTDSTKLEHEYGGFAAGVCVSVEVLDSDPTVAKEIEGKEQYKCTGQHDGEGAHGSLYGKVEELPSDGLIGRWIVAGKEISVTELTELDSSDAFSVGVTVKVDFVVISDTMVAKHIELKFGRHEDDHHGDDYGDHHGKEGQAYGVVESRPISPEVTGLWVIGGVEYTATEKTKFGDPVPDKDEVVEVKYFVQDDGSRLAFKIEAEDGHGQLDNPNVNKLVGTVDAITPTVAGGYLGTWIIAGAEFSATVDTKFDEEEGLLGVGAYVEVLYAIDENGVRVIVKLETHVPPGAGEHDCLGKVEALSRSGVAVAAQSPTAIVVDGVSYTVTSATQIVDANGNVVVGSTVAINSYTTAGGENVATRVNSVTLDYKLVLPFTQG